MLRFLTAGESHGQVLTAILEGMPAGLAVDFDLLATQLRRRQLGYGRGRRMAIESDRAQLVSGVRHGVTTGGPIALLIPNKDWENWQRTMAVESPPASDTPGIDRPVVTRPRPGHADLAGIAKYGHEDVRNVLERASARETAARVAMGALARQILAVVGAEVASHVFAIGAIAIDDPLAVTFEEARAIDPEAPLHCVNKDVETAILQNIGQMANSSLSGWSGSVEPTMGHLVIPLWQLSPRAKDGSYPRSRALPDLQTFEEFYAKVFPGKKLAGNLQYDALRSFADPQLAMFRVALMPPKAPSDVVNSMRTAFSKLWESPKFLADYSRIIKTKPILVSGHDGQDILAGLGTIKPQIKSYLVDYVSKITQ